MIHLSDIRVDSPRRVWLIVAVVTICAILVALLVTGILLWICGLHSTPIPYVIAGVIPLLIVPSVTYVLARIAYKLTVTQEDLLRLARTDELTGLHNRRSFFEQGHVWVQAATERRQILGLLLLDADNFKSVNDTFGHMAGDEALRYLAQQIRRCTTAEDIVARFGGDEFAVLRFGATHVQMAELAAAIQANLRAVPFIYHHHLSPLSLSTGVADTESIPTFDALMSAADIALYHRKGMGLLVAQNGLLVDHHTPSILLDEHGVS